MPVDLQETQPLALICAIMAGSKTLMTETRSKLEARLGPVRQASAAYDFGFTSYYAGEMGEGLIKQLLFFTELVDPAILPNVKLQTMELERQMGQEKEGEIHRRANIDPGLVSIESLVLATTKYSGHRICIGPSLFAEVTLLYQKGMYRPMEWTYPDYRSREVQDFLQEVRTHLMAKRS